MNRIVAISLFFLLGSAGFAVAGPTLFTFSAGAGAMSGGVNVAEEKGFFEEQGIKGTVTRYKRGRVAFYKYLEGKHDAATAGIFGVILTDFDISKHRIVATLANTDNQTKVLVKKSAGISSPSALKGKRIGTIRGSTAHFYLCQFLVANGILCDDVEVVFLSKKQMPNAIAVGEVDALCQHGMPIEKAKKKLGDDWAVYQDNSIIRKPLLLFMPIETLENKPEIVQGVLKAIMKGNEFIKTNTDEAVAIIAKAKNYPIDVMDKSVRHEMDYGLRLEQSLLQKLEMIEQWAIDKKLVERTTPRNYLDFIDYRSLEKLDAAKVTIIR